MAENNTSLIKLDSIFGLPPKTYVSDAMIVNSMPVMQILPGKPNFEAGMTLFRINTADGIREYKEILANTGFQLSGNEIRLAFIADNFPTDTFTNEYGETFLQQFTDVASSGMQQIAQMTNSSTGTEAIRTLGGTLEQAFSGVEGAAASILQGAASGMVALGEGMQKLKTNLESSSPFLGGALNSLDRMAAGHRVDFPMIWKNSSYTPSYTATIRLYNPDPGSKTSTKQYIAGPLAAILCLAVPQSDDGESFQWPFFHRIRCPGLYRLDPAVITNVTVIKGGDQQQISYKQSLGMVDVRIDFTSLYSSMVVEKNDSSRFKNERPTLKKYIDNITDWNEYGEADVIPDGHYYTRSQLRTNASRSAIINTNDTNENVVLITGANTDQAKTLSDQQTAAKAEAVRKMQSPTVAEKSVTDRVDESVQNVVDSLIAKSPNIYG